jgi:hypothetical protein
MTRPASSNGEIEQFGSVSCPSGILLVLDGGLAWMWSHDRPPLLPEYPEVVGATASARDLAVRGPDAFAAGTAFDRSNHPLYIYDQPADGLERLGLAFTNLVSEHKLNASLETLAERIPHRQRVDFVLEAGHGAGAVEFHGMWAVAIDGVPRDRSLRVMGERMPAGPDTGRWRRVRIEFREGEVAKTREIGHVLVDEARLMAVDADALGGWDDRNAPDGKADLVFWGRDAAAVAAEVGADPIQFAGEANKFGWADLPFDDARERAERISAFRSDDRKFALDFRPHTHHWQVMREVRATPTESGVLDLGGAQLCMFMTSWGDGAFPVEADLDASGQVLCLRIEVGCDKIVERQRDMDERWFGEFAKRAVVSARVARDGEPVRFLYREAPDRTDDSGWRVFAGDESDDYANTPENAVVLPLRDLLDRDTSLKEVLRTPARCAFEREDARAHFRRIEDFDFGGS